MQAEKSPEVPRPDSLDAWLQGLQALGLPQKCGFELRKSKAQRFAQIRALGLERTPVVSVNVSTFLKDPEFFLRRVHGDMLKTFLDSPDVEAVRAVSRWPVDRARLPELIRKLLCKRDREASVLTFLKAMPIVLNGNIIVRNNGELFGEFIRGAHSPAQQQAIIDCTVWRDNFLGTFSYSSEDRALCREIYRTVRMLPSWGEGHDRVFLPGYYEVALGRDATNLPLLPIFHDYRNAAFFIGD